jgi:hypothetical protein
MPYFHFLGNDVVSPSTFRVFSSQAFSPHQHELTIFLSVVPPARARNYLFVLHKYRRARPIKKDTGALCLSYAQYRNI